MRRLLFALLAVAVADQPAGPFDFVGNATDPFHTVYPGNRNLPDGYQYADATLFQDAHSQNKTYVYWRTRVNPQNTGFRAMQLTDDCRVYRNTYFECKRSQLDMRTRIRGMKQH